MVLGGVWSRGAVAPRRGLSLLARFGLLSGLVVVVLGFVLGALIHQIIEDRTETDARRSAVLATRIGIQPLLTPADLRQDFVPLTPERRAELDRALQGSLSSTSQVVRVKVWNRQHWIVWSDNDRLVGRWFAGDTLVDGSFRGEVTSEVTDLRDPEEFEERSFGQLLAVYVPLRAFPDADAFTDDPEAPVVGSFEVYLPYRPVAESIASDTARLQRYLAGGLLVLWVALFRLVASASRRLRRQSAANLHQARHDALTGLPNRVAFRDHLTSALEAGPLAVVLLDLDRFKEINDTLGHHHGDELLVQVGRRIGAGQVAGGKITVARLGGDEFAVLLPGLTDPATVVDTVTCLLEVLDMPIEVDGLALEVGGSAGIALAPQHGTTPDELLQRADVAMYLAKADRTAVEVYEPERDTYSSRRLALAHQVRRAIERRELVVHYQPKLDLRTMRIVGVEALVRWQHPELGLIPPAEFMPVVETTALINPLTTYVLDESIRQCREWRNRGVDLKVSINLSASSVLDAGLPGEVIGALDRHGVPPESLVLELTETTLLSNPQRAAEVLDRLKALGVRLSVDDFGTGYASLSYLKDLPVDELKIDRSFVAGMAAGGQAAVIVRFSIELARSLGLTVVAEGIEDLEVLDLLVDLGCDEVQGYLVARPGPPAEIEAVTRSFAAITTPSLDALPGDDRLGSGGRAGAHLLDDLEALR